VEEQTENAFKINELDNEREFEAQKIDKQVINTEIADQTHDALTNDNLVFNSRIVDSGNQYQHLDYDTN
jgi:hypothetical protein